MYPSKSNLLMALLLFCNLTVSWSASIGGHQYSAINTVSSSDDDKRIAPSNTHPSMSAPAPIEVEPMIESGTRLSPTFVYLDESQRPLLASGLRLKRGLRIPKKGYNDQPGSNIGFEDEKSNGGDENEDVVVANDSPHDYENNDDQIDFETDHAPETERLFSFAVNQVRKQEEPLLIQSQLLSQAAPRNLPSNYLSYPSHFLPLNLKSGLFSSPDSTYYRRASKRSPMCLRKCMAQGFLHPAQCHSLC